MSDINPSKEIEALKKSLDDLKTLYEREKSRNDISAKLAEKLLQKGFEVGYKKAFEEFDNLKKEDFDKYIRNKAEKASKDASWCSIM